MPLTLDPQTRESDVLDLLVSVFPKDQIEKTSRASELIDLELTLEKNLAEVVYQISQVMLKRGFIFSRQTRFQDESADIGFQREKKRRHEDDETRPRFNLEGISMTITQQREQIVITAFKS